MAMHVSYTSDCTKSKIWTQLAAVHSPLGTWVPEKMTYIRLQFVWKSLHNILLMCINVTSCIF